MTAGTRDELKVELPFIIRWENIARYENGHVFILDRRVYPFEVRYEPCANYEDTARAIENMVTQSGGPAIAAGYGMVQGAHQARNGTKAQIEAGLQQAARRLIDTRPTNNQIRIVVSKMLEAGQQALANGDEIEPAVRSAMENEIARRHQKNLTRGGHGASVLHDGDTILNHCWAESGIIYTLLVALQQGKRLSAYCTETRPYLQGARLTADAIAEMGIPTTVITDGMPAYVMSQGKISRFMSGADRVTMSGHVVNKVGTLPIALSAHHFEVPYYAFSFGPDPNAAQPQDVEMEERDPEEVLHCRSVRTATPKARGYYPAFDITPPQFVSAVITDRGVISPYQLINYYT